MKNLFSSILLSICLPACCIAQWQYLGPVNGFTSGNQEYLRMAISPVSQEPYVVFNDLSGTSKAHVMRYDGTSWQYVGPVNASQGMARYSSITIHPITGEPYIFFSEVPPLTPGGGGVYHYDGTAWVAVGNPGFVTAGVSISNTSIVLDPVTNLPYVSFNTTGTAHIGPYVYKFDGTNWVLISPGVNIAETPDMAFNPVTHLLYVVFCDGFDSYKAKVMVYDGTSWSFLPNVCNYTCSKTKIAFDPASGQPYVLYNGSNQPGSSYSSYHCVKYDGVSWHEVGYGNTSNSIYAALTISPVSHQPYIATGSSSNFTHKVQKYDGYNWVEVGNSPPTDYICDLEFNTQTNEPYVCYFAGNSAPCVKKFTPCTVATNDTLTVCTQYIRPSYHGIYTSSGVYADTVRSSAGCDSIANINLTVNTVDTSISVNGPVLTCNQAGAAYQWYNCMSGSIPGATNQSYTPSAPGYYAVSVTYNGCTEKSYCPIIEFVVSTSTRREMTIQPNPATDFISIQNIASGSTIQIYSAVGEKIFEQTQINGHEVSVDISSHPPGIYFVTVRSKTEVITKKVLKL